MHTTVELQDPFYYSTVIMIVLFALVIIPAVIWIASAVRRIRIPIKRKKSNASPKKSVAINKEKLRSECLSQINDIETLINTCRINRRSAFIRLSQTVREFIDKASGNNASALTLTEIKELDIPSLYSLIEKFYRPEFAITAATEEEMIQAFADARKVVREWN